MKTTTTTRAPTTDQVIAAACAAAGGIAPRFLNSRDRRTGRLYVARRLTAARRAVAQILFDAGSSHPELAAALGYASPSGPGTLLRRAPTRYEQRVEREARAALEGEVRA